MWRLNYISSSTLSFSIDLSSLNKFTVRKRSDVEKFSSPAAEKRKIPNFNKVLWKIGRSIGFNRGKKINLCIKLTNWANNYIWKQQEKNFFHIPFSTVPFLHELRISIFSQWAGFVLSVEWMFRVICVRV